MSFSEAHSVFIWFSNIGTDFLWSSLIQPINFAKTLSQISADIQYFQNCLSTVYKSQIFSYICEWRYEFRFERHYILRRCFSPAQPKIWTIFVLQSMGSVVNTPPVYDYVDRWSSGYCVLHIGRVWSTIVSSWVRPFRTFSGSYENGSTPLSIINSIVQEPGVVT